MLSALALTSCVPEIMEVEVTRVVKKEVEVETIVEKIIEVEVEVTREVRVDIQHVVEVERNAGQVFVLGSFIESDADNFSLAVKPFEEHTGIDVVYEGSRSFEHLLSVLESGGEAPDIAAFPQLGVMADLARAGKLVKLESMINTDLLLNGYGEAWFDLASVDGDIYGVWYRVSVSSLVWYPHPEFEASGYEIPGTWEEMIFLSDQIVSDGHTPWCLGMKSGVASGWPGTDWIEDIMLRASGPQVFDQWVRHEIPFNHPDVRRAFELFGEIALNPEYIYGGTVGILDTNFDDAIYPLLADPPQCYLHRQSGFLTPSLTDGLNADMEVGAFLLPLIDEKFGVPAIVTGDVFAALDDTPQVRALMAYLATTEPHFIWAGKGGHISPHLGVGLDVYGDGIVAAQAELLQSANTLRFDGSDMMPSSIGMGSFSSGMQDFIAGKDLDEVLTGIEMSWPDK